MRHFRPVAIAALLTAVAAACSAPAHDAVAKDSATKPGDALAAAVAAPTRTPANVARDKYRHPAETLAFFGVKPGDTVVELWPGAGWYTEILAPLAKAGGGTLYAAAPWDRGLNRVKAKQTENADVYGAVKLAEFPNAGTNPKVPDGSADVVLTFRNVHNWRFDGKDNTAEAFKQIFAMLKPGGTLGIVDHRLNESDDSAKEEKSGYMKESSIIGFAEAAGFKLAGKSEINANPKDTKDYPKGVWTLPPTLTEGDANRDTYLAIGESDRMTLKFVKPAS
ncbi:MULTISPECIES: methyltransferase domain-containing protein [unclassified Sphingopyxis]|uniref:class I SAM-dependent methyltransferase n=1 Tax=unclassified Sphingopyxis TaxID=2614943 RepID=UPI00073027E7|nr:MULTISPECIES: methyltransferase domain-containing protein [unclassified Sphingopyxis]KTE24730.1 methyltransferase type 11 [Sphingopyxis sp. H057]KTE50754.1 methyltransferase type 11 [Sphingopyxis sp. H073]KTE51740.1 methyltransferase type 11 [Sphingopyxis sp. H071]KTE56508.1 methyltransferase type 11 [Sphingopyxis sp. H107]KTE64306.1 methyltransferase type 11 [Sphingopyxis sp. H100]